MSTADLKAKCLQLARAFHPHIYLGDPDTVRINTVRDPRPDAPRGLWYARARFPAVALCETEQGPDEQASTAS